MPLYEMRTTHGVRVVLDKTSIIQAAPGTSAEEQYRAFVACQGDDVAGQWAVAEWCRTHALEPLRRQHLRRVLDLEPDHAGARQALGYTQVRGRWVTQAEFMQEQGYVLYRGKWQLSQEVERAEAERRTALAERQWYRQLLRWRHDWLTQRSEDVTLKCSRSATRRPCRGWRSCCIVRNCGHSRSSGFARWRESGHPRHATCLWTSCCRTPIWR